MYNKNNCKYFIFHKNSNFNFKTIIFLYSLIKRYIISLYRFVNILFLTEVSNGLVSVY